MPPLEVGTLALEYLQNFRSTMPNFKLGTVCSAIGIHVDVSQTHTALYDAKLAMQLYDKTKIGVVMDFSQKQYSMQFRKPQIPEDDIPF